MGLTDMLLEHGGGVVGSMASKFGVSESDAKKALDKIVPFVRDKVGGGGRAAPPSVATSAKDNDLQRYASDPARLQDDDDAERHGESLLAELSPDEIDAHAREVADATGLDVLVVRRMLAASTSVVIGALHCDGRFNNADVIKADAADGVVDGIMGKPVHKK